MHLRGIPAETERLAKIEAARRGISLSDFVAEAIHQAARVPQDDAERRLAPLAAERAWYESHRDEIAAEYAGRIVAIADGGVVAAGDILIDVAREVRARIGDRPAYVVNFCAEQNRALPPSPARRRR